MGMEEILHHVIDLLSTWTLRVSHIWHAGIIVGVFLAYGTEPPVRFRMKGAHVGHVQLKAPKLLCHVHAFCE